MTLFHLRYCFAPPSVQNLWEIPDQALLFQTWLVAILSALLHSFAPFCTLLRTYVCGLLRSFALISICALLRISASDRV